MAPPTGAVPPPLPPSVEEAYRRKCIQLKQRMNEVEEANDAARLRLVRIGREIEKMRLERAFLLENLAKRTSTNVEDSEGSPSPPPTRANDTNLLQPKEKPLRTKRGHRKPSFLTNIGDGRAGSTFIQQGPNTLSPSSDAFSHTNPDPSIPLNNSTPQTQPPKRQLPASNANGRASPIPRILARPKNAFDLYCTDMSDILTVQHRFELAEGTTDIDRLLAEGWQKATADQKDQIQQRFEKMKREWDTEKEGGIEARLSIFDYEQATPAPAPAKQDDEDIEMAEEAGTPSADGGLLNFTPRD